MDKKILDNLAKVSSGVGIPLQSLEKELRLFEFIPKFFNLVEENGIPAVLYGGTALNKGFFKEKQRFSKDLDIYLPSRNFKNNCSRINKLLHDLEGYKIEKMHQSKDAAVWSAGYGEKNWENLLIEVRKQQVKGKMHKLELHSLLEFAGLPILPVYVPSYSFEYILAGKIISLSRRAIGKDIYDVNMGLKLKPDIQEVKSFIKALTKKDAAFIINEAVYWLDKVDIGKQADIAELQDSVPIAYGGDVRSMINSLKYELKRL